MRTLQQLSFNIPHHFWTSSKIWRSVGVGPISVYFRLGRNVGVSSNLRRRLARFIQNLVNPAIDDHSVFPVDCSKPAPSIPENQPERETALLLGVGPGLGFALAQRLAASGMNVALAARNAERLDSVVAALKKISPPNGQLIQAYGCDATSESSVKQLVSLVAGEMGAPHFMAYATQGFVPGRVIDMEVCAFEECWRQNCLGAFIAAKEMGRVMAASRRGTIVFIGSTSSIIGRADHLSLAVGKFGLRALAQVVARELWSNGIHVVHLVIDADIKENELYNDDIQTNPEDIASLIHALHRQPRSAWTSEVDVRPFNGKWWEHC